MKAFLALLIIIAVASTSAHKKQKCTKLECPAGEVYQKMGPGPFCYQTCCGPRGPPCFSDSFTTGCFCQEGFIKVNLVTNNTVGEPNNPCIPIEKCNSALCDSFRCTKANEEWRDCGPTSLCDKQVCRGIEPICTEEDAQECVADCFCKPGFSRFNGECIQKCPLLP